MQTITITAAPKAGGNTGGGTIVLPYYAPPAGAPYLPGLQEGVYQVVINGGDQTAVASPDMSGNVGDGTCEVIFADTNVMLGEWSLIAVDAETFTVIMPDTTEDGEATVGVEYTTSDGMIFLITAGAIEFAAGDTFLITVGASAVVTPDPGNTGDGTLEVSAVDPLVALGDWTVECSGEDPGGGTFSVFTPDLNFDGDATVGVEYTTGDGMVFLITAGPVDFALDDLFTITVSFSATAAPKPIGNVGDGTCDINAVGPATETGEWQLSCTAEDPDSGTFTVIRPSSVVDGDATVGVQYTSSDGLSFTINDGAIDFATGDAFVITVTDIVPPGGGTFSVTGPDAVALPDGTVNVEYATPITFTVTDGDPDFIIGDGFDISVVFGVYIFRLIPEPYGMTWQDWADTVVGFTPELRGRVSSDDRWNDFASNMAQYIPKTPKPELFTDWQSWASALRLALSEGNPA